MSLWFKILLNFPWNTLGNANKFDGRYYRTPWYYSLDLRQKFRDVYIVCDKDSTATEITLLHLEVAHCIAFAPFLKPLRDFSNRCRWKGNSKIEAIQVVRYDSLVFARQNMPITSTLTDFTLGSWKYFDVSFSLIGSKEMEWITSFVLSLLEYRSAHRIESAEAVIFLNKWFGTACYDKIQTSVTMMHL